MGLRRALHALLLAAACLGVYANAFDHAYNLDSHHSIRDNAWLRDLEHVPRYFVDAGTFSTLRSNVDYRPVLQTTYALNHAAGGYEMWGWHLVQVLLHWACALGLYALCIRVAGQMSAREAPRGVDHVAFVAALVFAVHPACAGVIDYLPARSTLLAAAFAFGAVLSYAKPHETAEYDRARWGAAALLTLALFTKVEAVAALAILLLWDVWQTARRRQHAAGFFSDLLATLTPATLRRLAPALAVAALYGVVRSLVMADFDFGASRVRADVGSYEYLLTQLVAWWHYLARWWAPVDLIADYGSYPIQRSLTEGVVLLALAAWVTLGVLLLAQWRRRPHLLFLALSALALLSPTSSFLPLAEMVNEHRPYAAVALLSLAWTLPLARVAQDALADAGPAARGAAALGLAGLIGALALLTVERNRVFASEEAYWADVVAKAPSARAHLNYGRTFMRRGEYEEALDHFERSLSMAPRWHVTHVNLGVIHQARGDLELAARHYDFAVRDDAFTGTALSWRGEFRLSQGEYARALADFEASGAVSLQRYRNCKGAATALAGLGDAEAAHLRTRDCLAIDSERTQLDITTIVAPFFAAQDRWAAGLEYFRRLEGDLPEAWWVHENLARLALRLGDRELAQSARRRAIELNPKLGERDQ